MIVGTSPTTRTRPLINFELPGDEAITRKQGNRLIVEPIARPSLLAVLTTPEALKEDFPEIEDLLPEDEAFLVTNLVGGAHPTWPSPYPSPRGEGDAVRLRRNFLSSWRRPRHGWWTFWIGPRTVDPRCALPRGRSMASPAIQERRRRITGRRNPGPSSSDTDRKDSIADAACRTLGYAAPRARRASRACPA